MQAGQDKSANPYLKTKVMTASPQELRLMLYEGVLRFARQTQQALTQNRWEVFCDALLRTQNIVLELSASMRSEAAPELCEKLDALYMYIYQRLVDVNITRDSAILDEVLSLLTYEKQSWEMLMAKIDEEAASPGILTPSSNDSETSQQLAAGGLSVSG